MTAAFAPLPRRLLTPLLAVAACLAGAVLALAAMGFGRSPRDDGSVPGFGQGAAAICAAAWDGSIRPGTRYDDAGVPDDATRYRNWVQTLLAATPLLLTGLSVTVAFRAAVLNIGSEGQFLAGAIAATAVAVHWPGRTTGLALPAVLLAAAGAGALLAAIAGALERWRNVPVVLGTLLLNFVAMEALTALLNGPLRGATPALASDRLPVFARLPSVWPSGARTQLHAGAIVALAAAALVAFVLRQTTFGFRLRAVGANPEASRFAGMRVARVAAATLAISGALAGLAGGVQVAGVIPWQLLPSLRGAGLGFAGIAVALLGRLSIGGVVLSALFFGWLNTAFGALATELDIPAVMLQATQGAILIAMLVLTNVRWRRRPRSKLGGSL